MIQFGNDKIEEIYYGSDKIKEVYHGADLVWSGMKPSYAILTNDTRVDFELENTPINNLSGTSSTVVINGSSIQKADIKELVFGTSYKNVTIINNNFLRNFSSLTSLDLSGFRNVTSIGDYFMGYCSALTSLDLSGFRKVTSIGNYFLYRCSSLTSVDLSAFRNVTSIGDYFLRNCSDLTQFKIGAVNVPSTSTTGFLFYSQALTTILVPMQSVQAYKTTAPWSDHASKISAIIPAIQDGYWVHKDTGVKTYFGLEEVSIGTGKMGAPSWRTLASEVKIPYGVTELDTSCFSGCSSLTSITLPESVTHLWNFCFNGCSALTSITLPESFISLGGSCFRGCSSLTSITIPSGVTSLGGSCFYGCTSLTSITIPAGITSIGYACFYECTSLTLATVRPATPPSLGEYAFDVVHSSFNIKVHSPYVNAYKAATNWKSYASKISAI